MKSMLKIIMFAVLAAGVAEKDIHAAVRVQGAGLAFFDEGVQWDSNLNDADGSVFGFNAIISDDGSASGQCQFLMAGLTDNEGYGPQVLTGKITEGMVKPDGTVTFYATGYLRNWKGLLFKTSMLVTVTPGGATRTDAVVMRPPRTWRPTFAAI